MSVTMNDDEEAPREPKNQSVVSEVTLLVCSACEKLQNARPVPR